MAEQTERAFQKQQTVFLNNKLRTLGIGKKAKKDIRYVRNVGLGFKTPREVTFQNILLHFFIYIFTIIFTISFCGELRLPSVSRGKEKRPVGRPPRVRRACM